MGTRSLTVLPADGGGESAVLYRQYDGYPEGHGLELAALLVGLVEVNGLSANPERVFNGAACLSASIVSHFKRQPGDFYLYPAGTRDTGEEYVYAIECHGPGTVPTVRVEDCYAEAPGPMFEGKPTELFDWATAQGARA